MRKSAIEQVRLEAFAEGYRRAQNDAAARFGGLLSYEQANAAMIKDSADHADAVRAHIAEHGEWVPA